MIEKKKSFLERQEEGIPCFRITRQKRVRCRVVQQVAQKQAPLRNLVTAPDELDVPTPVNNLVRGWTGYREQNGRTLITNKQAFGDTGPFFLFRMCFLLRGFWFGYEVFDTFPKIRMYSHRVEQWSKQPLD